MVKYGETFMAVSRDITPDAVKIDKFLNKDIIQDNTRLVI